MSLGSNKYYECGVRTVPQGTSVGTGAGAVTSTQAYNVHGELTDLDWTLGGTPWYHEHLVRDALGRITQVDETIAGSSTSRVYGYHAAGWLDSVATGVNATSRTYQYDGNASGGNGNRTQERDGSGAVLAGASHGVLTHTASCWSR